MSRMDRPWKSATAFFARDCGSRGLGESCRQTDRQADTAGRVRREGRGRGAGQRQRGQEWEQGATAAVLKVFWNPARV